MLIDGRTLDEGATLEADVCIAGAGAAGMTIAMDLRGSGMSVVPPVPPPPRNFLIVP